MSITERAVKNIFWLLVSQVCARGLNFLGTIYLARALGVVGFGFYSLATAVIVYLCTIADMGITGYGTREIAKNTCKAEEMLETLNSLRLAISIVTFLLLCGVLFVWNPPDKIKWLFLTGGFYVIAFTLSPEWVLKGVEKMEYIALGDTVVGIAFLGSIYLMVESPADTVAAIFYRSFAFFLGSMATLVVLKQKLNIIFSLKYSPSIWWYHLKDSWYFLVSGCFFILARYIPIFFLGIWATVEEVGLFSAPHGLIILLINGAMLVVGASYPILSETYVADKVNFQKTHRSFQKLMIYISLPVTILGMFLSREIIELIYGHNYIEASRILKIMIWFVPLTFLKIDYGNSLLSAGFQKFNMYVNGGGLIVAILLHLFLVPSYGCLGAALATVGSEAITLVFMGLMFSFKLHYSNPFDSYFLKVIAASTATGILIINMNLPVLLKIFTGFITYGIFSLLFGVINREVILGLYQTTISHRFQT